MVQFRFSLLPLSSGTNQNDRFGPRGRLALLALPAVFVGLWIGGVALDISAMMGLTVVVGIVAEVALFFVSDLQEQLRTHVLDEAVVHARRQRLRPIVMSALRGHAGGGVALRRRA